VTSSCPAVPGSWPIASGRAGSWARSRSWRAGLAMLQRVGRPHRLRDRSAPALVLFAWAVGDGGAADGDRAGRRRREQRGHRVGRQQRDRAVAGLLAVAALGAVVAAQFGAPSTSAWPASGLSPEAQRIVARPSSARWRARSPTACRRPRRAS
jgi:hypothetical protein